MKTLASLALALIGLCLGAVSAYSNYHYGFSVGQAPMSQIYGVGGALLDVLKSLIPSALLLAGGGRVSGAFSNVHGVMVRLLAWTACCVLTLLSLWCALSNYAVGADARRSGVEAEQARFERLTADESRLTDEIAAARLALAGRSSEQVRAEIEIIEREPLFYDARYSDRCANDTAEESRRLCDDWRRLRAELAAAPSAANARGDLARAGRDLASVREALRGIDLELVKTEAEPALARMAAALGVSVDTASLWRAVIYAVAFEFGGPITLALAVMIGLRGARSAEPQADEATAPTRPAAAPKQDSDELEALRAWLASATMEQSGARIASADMREAWNAQAARLGAPVMNPTAFGRAMTALGVRREQKSGQRCYIGRAFRPAAGRLTVIAGGRCRHRRCV